MSRLTRDARADRQQQVLHWLSESVSIDEMARRLGCSVSNVRCILEAIERRLERDTAPSGSSRRLSVRAFNAIHEALGAMWLPDGWSRADVLVHRDRLRSRLVRLAKCGPKTVREIEAWLSETETVDGAEVRQMDERLFALAAKAYPEAVAEVYRLRNRLDELKGELKGTETQLRTAVEKEQTAAKTLLESTLRGTGLRVPVSS
jgi:hypothetical protein